MNRQSVFSFFFLSLLMLTELPVLQTSIRGKVVRIKDGDTIDILYNEKKLTVRLAHIDCPEKAQPYGAAAKKFVSDKCYGQVVTIVHHNGYDRNKRLIAEVINSNGENINKELVKAGLAWHFKKYSSDTSYARLEIAARQQKTGLWSQPNPIAPWNWRKNL